MREINRFLYAMISKACKCEGTYDPVRVLPHFEEDLTPQEYRTLEAFLQWVHDNNKNFGHGTYQERFDEWREATQ